jgi:hypothetical protein
MQVFLITVEKSIQIDRNYITGESEQVRVIETDSEEDLGEGVPVVIDDDTTVFISEEFIRHFSEKLGMKE